MSSFSRSLFAQPETEAAASDPDVPAEGLESLFGDVPDMNPTWAESSSFFHTKARCTRYQAIEAKNRRTQKIEPTGMTLCEICKKITQRGRKG